MSNTTPVNEFIKKQNSSVSNQLVEISSDKNYFANIPNRFQFTKKKGSAADTEPSDHINNILKVLDKTSDISAKIEWLKSQKTTDVCCCCGSTTEPKQEDFINCIIKKNYFFAEGKTSGLSNISTKIKDSESCCNNKKTP